MKVPFLDLKAQYVSIKDEIDVAIQEVLDSCAFAGGPFVEKFEKEWAAYCGVKHAVGVGSGTDALWLILAALGIGQGDEVITVSSTFIATAEAISRTGAKPVFVDIDEKHYTMDSKLLKASITPLTKVIVPVHLFGQTADMESIMKEAQEHGLLVVEDACQAHGATYKGSRAGSIGVAGAFSFYPGKNLGAYGEAGAVTTNNEEIAEKIRLLRDHGQSKKYHHDMLGWNGRMDGIQAAVLRAKLKHLDEWNEKRRQWASFYDSILGNVKGIVTPASRDDIEHVYHVYAVRVEERDKVLAEMQSRGIGCGIHYPIPVHCQKAYAGLDSPACPVAERCAREFLSLPMYADLEESLVVYASDTLKQICQAL